MKSEHQKLLCVCTELRCFSIIILSFFILVSTFYHRSGTFHNCTRHDNHKKIFQNSSIISCNYDECNVPKESSHVSSVFFPGGAEAAGHVSASISEASRETTETVPSTSAPSLGTSSTPPGPGRTGTAEPVLSLHYSTEGTTTSTIKLDFTDEW